MRSYQAQRIRCERKLFGRLPPTLDCCLVDDKKSKAPKTKIEKLEIFEIEKNEESTNPVPVAKPR